MHIDNQKIEAQATRIELRHIDFYMACDSKISPPLSRLLNDNAKATSRRRLNQNIPFGVSNTNLTSQCRVNGTASLGRLSNFFKPMFWFWNFKNDWRRRVEFLCAKGVCSKKISKGKALSSSQPATKKMRKRKLWCEFVSARARVACIAMGSNYILSLNFHGCCMCTI